MYSLKKKIKYSVSIIVFFFIFIACLNIFTENIVHTISYDRSEINKLNLIIDPGHGGEDGGAVSKSNIRESELNLAITLKTKDILGLYGIIPTLTRDSEEIDYPSSADSIHSKKVADQKARLELINSTPNAILISIHQNNFSSTKPFGSETLYSQTEGSKEFAENMQSLLINNLNPENYRIASKISDSIYLMNNIKCPGILIECGFLSNPQEESLLKTDAYQLKISSVIAGGYLSNESQLAQLYFGGTNESENSFLLH